MNEQIETPCNKVCVIDPVTDWCIGCGRTGSEVAGWIGYSADERRRIMSTLSERMSRMTDRQTRVGRERQRNR